MSKWDMDFAHAKQIQDADRGFKLYTDEQAKQYADDRQAVRDTPPVDVHAKVIELEARIVALETPGGLTHE